MTVFHFSLFAENHSLYVRKDTGQIPTTQNQKSGTQNIFSALSLLRTKQTNPRLSPLTRRFNRTMPITKARKSIAQIKTKFQIRKRTPNPCAMEPFHPFGSCSSTSNSISSTNSEDEEMPRIKTTRFESFRPVFRGKRKNYVRSTSKMNLSRR